MPTEADAPILEFDPAREAFIEPSRVISRRDIPPRVVVCFFTDVIAQLVSSGRARKIHAQTSELGEHAIHELDVDGRRLALYHPGIGAPLAAALLEEVIALGGERFVACGGAGALDPTLAVGHLVVPTAAVRDEGTSYHYLAPSRTVEPSPEAVAAIESTLRRHGLPYHRATTWTTDAFYRETPDRIARRRAEGCAVVEMEAAAFFAVARFRGKRFGQLLYAGDDLSGETWDPRGWDRHTVRERLFWLAAEACLEMA